MGNHIDILSKKWVAQDAGIGAGVDSYFEYLVKGAIMLQDEELLSMFLGDCLDASPPDRRSSCSVQASTLPSCVQITTGPFRTTPALTTGTSGCRCTKEPSPCLFSSHLRPSGPACRWTARTHTHTHSE